MTISFHIHVMKPITRDHYFLAILKISFIGVLLGRSWQFLFWDAPYRSLMWDQALMQNFVSSVFNMSWEEWASSSSVDFGIQIAIRITGVLFVISIFALLLFNKERQWPKYILWVAQFFLVLLAILQTKEKFYHFGQFFEHASQLGVFIGIIGHVNGWLKNKRMEFFLKACIALTFFCHGLYAINYYPRPGNFVDMFINILHTSEKVAHQAIAVIGVIDILIAGMLFVSKLDKWVLYYCLFWGIITAFARLLNGFYIDFPLQSLHQVWHTVSYRLVHGLLPMSTAVYCGYLKFKFRKSEKMVSLGT